MSLFSRMGEWLRAAKGAVKRVASTSRNAEPPPAEEIDPIEKLRREIQFEVDAGKLTVEQRDALLLVQKASDRMQETLDAYHRRGSRIRPKLGLPPAL